ncbi:JmjC domain-containing protein [Bradyrhizobium sp. HKCCYLS3077]|uniref:JmjC domain-containing protein n=1 Tax=Bradyrhizobium sp. HKCCYLS3077 TaxID=3420761 RepID=UPI003EBB8D4B
MSAKKTADFQKPFLILNSPSYRAERFIDINSVVRQNIPSTYYVRADYELGKRLEPNRRLPHSAQFEEFRRRLQSGWTLISDGTERVCSEILELSQAIAEALGYICRANLYITPSGVRGFPPHYDAHDVLVLHLHGTKVWKVANEQVRVPRRNELSPPDLEMDSECQTIFTLRPGDILYIPKGFPHVVDNTSDGVGAQLTFACASIHLEDIVLQCIAERLKQSDPYSRNFPYRGSADDLAVARESILSIAVPFSDSEIDAAIKKVRRNHSFQMDHHTTQDLLGRTGQGD